VVAKLLHAVEPDVAFFGQKDAQQARVVQRMVRDLQFGCRIEVGPIVREEDGLALSSRNARLADHHRAQAPALFAGLRRAEREFGAGEREAPVLESAVREVIHRDAPDAEVEYVQTSDWETLKPVQGQIRSRALLSLAARFGDVRLIDNVELTP
jgi:pantoate--beta-alanine ligase